MDLGFRRALSAGSERLAAWSDLLDRINVFPVADGDTGRNLVISLAPLRDPEALQDGLVEALLMSARGNSGNIAAQFFSGMLSGGQPGDLVQSTRRGRDLAWKAVADPKPGTMLSLLDALVEALETSEAASGASEEGGDDSPDAVLDRMERAVIETREQLPALEQAGVVDSGALGMFIFFDGFFNTLYGRAEGFRPIAERFKQWIAIQDGFESHAEDGFCVDAVVRSEEAEALIEELSAMGESVVTMTQGNLVKVHLHTADVEAVREKLRTRSDLVRFASDDLQEQTAGFVRPDLRQAIHVMTDAAGSVTRADARRLGMTVLDSYVNVGVQSVPETHLRPDDLYAAMRAGVPVSTSQASVFARHQHYRKVLGLHERVLYVCVGSFYTGNHQVVSEWKKEHDPDDRLVVIDSGAASGRLALMALGAAERALAVEDAEAVIDWVRQSQEACEEYIFLDQLKYLAKGGRLSKTSAFFGDLLHMKPVISPLGEGAKKVAVVRTRDDQVTFALERLAQSHARSGPGLVLLEYTDNREWVETEVLPKVRSRFEGSRLVVQPVSLTSGAHMGPGTWAVAYGPNPVPTKTPEAS